VLFVVKQEHGVDKIYKLEPGKPLSDCEKYANTLTFFNCCSNCKLKSIPGSDSEES